METLPLDQQKKAILYAPKDLLWAVLEAEDAWLKVLSVLPAEYFSSFLSTIQRAGIKKTDTSSIKVHAKMFVKHKVRKDHLQAAIVSVWSPSDLEESTSWLKEKGFLGRPLMPLNLQAAKAVIHEARALSLATKERLARSDDGNPPRSGHPPESASVQGRKMWNRVLRCQNRRKIIFKPRSLQDQWALAHRFWITECARSNCKPYAPGGNDSKVVHAQGVIGRSLQELHSGLAHAGYSMSRPASRTLKKLWQQLERDGLSLDSWSSIRPKRKL